MYKTVAGHWQNDCVDYCIQSLNHPVVETMCMHRDLKQKLYRRVVAVTIFCHGKIALLNAYRSFSQNSFNMHQTIVSRFSSSLSFS